MDPAEQDLLNIKDPWTRKLVMDTYLGQGPNNPSITTRLATYEERQDAMEDKVNKIETKIDRGFWLLLATLVSAVGSLIMLAFKHV